jgi:hypothetical protein
LKMPQTNFYTVCNLSTQHPSTYSLSW